MIIEKCIQSSSQVTDVSCSKSGNTSLGTLHLTTHHMIFVYDDSSKEEMWVRLTEGS